MAASFDVARGRYNELGLGLMPSWYPDYMRILHDQYGIEHVRIAGCVVSDASVAYMDGYNAVSRAAAMRRFGRNVFSDSMSKAIEIRRASLLKRGD